MSKNSKIFLATLSILIGLTFFAGYMKTKPVVDTSSLEDINEYIEDKKFSLDEGGNVTLNDNAISHSKLTEFYDVKGDPLPFDSFIIQNEGMRLSSLSGDNYLVEDHYLISFKDSDHYNYDNLVTYHLTPKEDLDDKTKEDITPFKVTVVYVNPESVVKITEDHEDTNEIIIENETEEND